MWLVISSLYNWSLQSIFTTANFYQRFPFIFLIKFLVLFWNKKYFLIVSLNNPQNKHLNQNLFKYLNKNFLLFGDLNAKSKEYNNENNIIGNELKKIIEEHQLFILNQNREPTSYILRMIVYHNRWSITLLVQICLFIT